MEEMKYLGSVGRVITFDDFVDETEEYNQYWVGMCGECITKYKENLGDKVPTGSPLGTCSVKGCRKEADYYIDFSEDEIFIYRTGVHEYIYDLTREENAWINVKELAERFVEMDKHFNHEPLVP